VTGDVSPDLCHRIERGLPRYATAVDLRMEHPVCEHSIAQHAPLEKAPRLAGWSGSPAISAPPRPSGLAMIPHPTPQ
jgi:hypothetical protein